MKTRVSLKYFVNDCRRQSLTIQGFGVLVYLPSISHKSPPVGINHTSELKYFSQAVTNSLRPSAQNIEISHF